MQKPFLIFLALLSACETIQAPTYDLSSQPIGAHEHAIDIVGKPGVGVDQLTGFVQAHGRKLCDGAYLLRRWREDAMLDASDKTDHYELKAEIECIL